MSGRHLHIAGSVQASLQIGQMDAIELACLDSCYTPRELDSPAAAAGLLEQNPSDLLLVDVESFIQILNLNTFTAYPQVVLILFERDNPKLEPYLEAIAEIRYLVGANTPTMLRAVMGSILEYHLTGKSRGLRSKLIHVEGLTRFNRNITASDQRSAVQEEVLQFFKNELTIHADKVVEGVSSFPKHLADALDELLMNAIWDANLARATVERTVAARLDPGETVSVEATSDGYTLSLTVEDSHGTFPRKAVLKPMKFALGFREDTTINEGPGGAGLGLYLILQRVTAISFEVFKGTLTRVTIILRTDLSLREMQRRPRTILYFEEG